MLYIPVESIDDGEDYRLENRAGYNLTSNKVRCDRCGKIHDLPMNRASGFPNEEDVEDIGWVVGETNWGHCTAHLCPECAGKVDKSGNISSSIFGAPYENGFSVNRRRALHAAAKERIRVKMGKPEPHTGPIIISGGQITNDKPHKLVD